MIDLGAHFGGVENYLVSLANLLEGEVEMFALCVLPELEKRLSAAGVETRLFPAFAGILKPLRFLVAAVLLPILLIRKRIDVVQVNGFLEATLMLPARLLGRKAVYTRHGPFELDKYRWFRQPLRFLPRALARVSVHLATMVVCVSETVGAGVKSIRPQVPVVVIPNWLAGQEAMQPVRSAWDDPVRVLCAGRLEQYKGIHLVIEALHGMENVQLTVAGEGPYRAALEEMAANRMLSGRVSFAGFQNDMHAYYKSADIFVMPSLGPEGMPMSSLEAMGRGIPCILSDLPVHREITDDGVRAMLFASGDPSDLRFALERLFESAELRANYGREAYRVIGARYTAERVKAAYVKLFAET